MTKNTLVSTKKFNINQEKAVVVPTRILVEVVYGLSSRNCKGMGICKINAVQNPADYLINSTCCSSLAYLQVTNTNSIRLDFLKTTISPIQYAERFASGIFHIGEIFVFPSALAQTLNNSATRIATGEYPIQIEEEFIRVEFAQF